MKCKKPTDTIHEEYVEVDSTKGLRGMIKGICTIWSKKKSKFVRLRSTPAAVPVAIGEGSLSQVRRIGRSVGKGSLSQGRRIGRGASEQQIISEIKNTIDKLKKK